MTPLRRPAELQKLVGKPTGLREKTDGETDARHPARALASQCA